MKDVIEKFLAATQRKRRRRTLTAHADACRVCGGPNSRKSAYCSGLCRTKGAYRRERGIPEDDRTALEIRNCLTCGQEFKPKNAGKLYCSKQCSSSQVNR